jgi:hypothetical protein
MSAVADTQFSRRAFLKGGGAVVVAFGVPLAVSSAADGDTIPFPKTSMRASSTRGSRSAPTGR